MLHAINEPSPVCLIYHLLRQAELPSQLVRHMLICVVGWSSAQGSRSCVGLKLAYAEALIALVRLYQRFRFQLVPGQWESAKQLVVRPIWQMLVVLIQYFSSCNFRHASLPYADGETCDCNLPAQLPLRTEAYISHRPKAGVNVRTPPPPPPPGGGTACVRTVPPCIYRASAFGYVFGCCLSSPIARTLWGWCIGVS